MSSHVEPALAPDRVLSVRLFTSPAAPWLARQLVAQWCREWRLPERVLDDAVLVVSELINDLVATGVGSFTVSAAPAQAALEVSVTGPVSRVVGPQGTSQDDLTVRRVGLVEGLAAWVDVRLDEAGRTVVAAIPLRRAR